MTKQSMRKIFGNMANIFVSPKKVFEDAFVQQTATLSLMLSAAFGAAVFLFWFLRTYYALHVPDAEKYVSYVYWDSFGVFGPRFIKAFLLFLVVDTLIIVSIAVSVGIITWLFFYLAKKKIPFSKFLVVGSWAIFSQPVVYALKLLLSLSSNSQYFQFVGYASYVWAALIVYVGCRILWNKPAPSNHNKKRIK
jgi:hypothetical protein